MLIHNTICRTNHEPLSNKPVFYWTSK